MQDNDDINQKLEDLKDLAKIGINGIITFANNISHE